MKNILLFGAGKSATVLIEFLKDLCTKKKYTATIADFSYDVASAKVNNHPSLKAVQINIEEDVELRAELISAANIVISLMPPTLHLLIAKDCLRFNKNLLTASYIDTETKQLADEIQQKGLLFLYEMGLDPGIDHMSAMKIIDEIQEQGGVIESFYSHCGGLIAPESDDNPWHYKISWNPKNVVNAGKAGATYKEDNTVIYKEYRDLFGQPGFLQTPANEKFAYYPNRDSLGYIETYNLPNAKHFVRTTLRHPDFMHGWKNVVELNLTSEEQFYDTDNLSIADFFKQHLEKNGFSKWLDELLKAKLDTTKQVLEQLMKLTEAEEEQINTGEEPDSEIMIVNEQGKVNTLQVDETKADAAEVIASTMHEANLAMKQLFFLGLEDEETIINKGVCSAADVLQFILEKKLALLPHDKDMIIMQHQIGYSLNGEHKIINSYLNVKGNNQDNTAMAKTVGLPLGLAAELILESQIKEKGLLIPTNSSIYTPILKSLEAHGIIFNEYIH